MSNDTAQTLVEIAKAIDDRSPVVFMPMVADFVRSVAHEIEKRDLMIEELQTKLSEFL
jgi:hypothetical protein